LGECRFFINFELRSRKKESDLLRRSLFYSEKINNLPGFRKLEKMRQVMKSMERVEFFGEI